MRVGIGSDEELSLVDELERALHRRGAEVVRVAISRPWPEVGRAVGEAVASGVCDRGVVCCWTGTGVSIAANKVAGVRAALCSDAETACGARRYNDANVLALSLRLVSPSVCEEILEAFLSTDVDETEQANIDDVELPS